MKIMFPILSAVIIFMVCALSIISKPENPSRFLSHLDKSISPETLIFSAVETHSILILGERHMMAQPKELLVSVLPRLHHKNGFDYLALEIGDTYQDVVDRFLDSGDEKILTGNPWTLLSPKHATREFLEIYRTVYRINQESDRKIKIICMDYDPQQYGTNPDLLKNRNQHMTEVLQNSVFAGDPDARLIIYVGSGHGAKLNLKEFTKELDPFGIMMSEDPLGMRLENAYPNQVFSIYIDGIVINQLGRDNSISEPGSLFEKGLIPDKYIPFALEVTKEVEAGWRLMDKVPVIGCYEGYIFYGKARKPEFL